MHIPSRPMSTLPPNLGDLAPDIDLPTPVGGVRRLSSLAGSPVVVAFHDTHWDPSRAEQVARYAALASDSCSDAPLGDAILIRNDDAAAEQFGVWGMSAVFVVDANGAVAWRYVSGVDPLSSAASVAELGAVGLDARVPSNEWSRRQFIATALGAAIAIALHPGFGDAEVIESAATPASVGDARPVTLNVNGKPITLTLEPRVTLLDALREYAGLTGSKKGCDHGQCGACTVHIDGRRVLSCLTLAVMQQNAQITTIEGLAQGDALHPMQQAFIEHDGFQCGYCTSGQIMSATAVLREPWGPQDSDVREAMSGNICRCGAYPGIVAAVQDVRQRGGGQSR